MTTITETARETMTRLAREIVRLDQDQQKRLADIALGMVLAKEMRDKKGDNDET